MADHWIQLIVGFWLLLSPWLMGFSGISVMMWSNLIAGLILILMGLWAIFDPPAAPALRTRKKEN